jgi:hypothetical protein
MVQDGNQKGGATMDEPTRIIIAYAALFTGLPVFAAKIVWVVPGAVAAILFSHIAEGFDVFMDAVIEGFLSLLFACLLFEQLNVPVVWKIPTIMIIVSTLWRLTKPEVYSVFPSIAGIVAGFLLYPRVWLYVSMRLGWAV